MWIEKYEVIARPECPENVLECHEGAEAPFFGMHPAMFEKCLKAGFFQEKKTAGTRFRLTAIAAAVVLGLRIQNVTN